MGEDVPDFLLYDMGTEFSGSDLQSGIERMCIQPIVCDQEAPWENGVCERRGDLFKKVYYNGREIAQPRDMDEVGLLIFESAWALQTTINRSGFTPAQRVLGRQPRMALDLTSDDKHYELAARATELRDAARKALMEIVVSAGQPRSTAGRWRAMSLCGGRAAGALAKVGPCFVILQRGLTVWVTRRGELWKCNAPQVFGMGPLEVQGLEVIPKDLLMAKERLRFDSEKLGFVDVTQENADSSDLERSPLDGQGQVRAEHEPVAEAAAAPAPQPPAAIPEDDLPSDVRSYAPSLAPQGPPGLREGQPRPSTTSGS